VIPRRRGPSTRTSSACPLVNAFEINVTKTGRAAKVLHSFYRMGDGSCLAFFEAPEQPFEFKEQHDFDLHIALEVPHADLQPWIDKARAAGKDVRGPADHEMIDSIYFRDPNGYVIELTGKRPNHDLLMDPANNHARQHLQRWQSEKTAAR
jgi:catechol-2,3-dioxygenase